MWFHYYYFLIFLIISLRCNDVKNNEPNKLLYDRVYLANNVQPDQIRSKFLQIIDTITNTSSVAHKNKKLQQRNVKSSFRNNNRYFVVAMVDNRNEREPFAREGLSIEYSRNSDPGSMKKEIVNLKSNILRDKYADACIKVAVRKCFKALIAVDRNVCKARFRCKSSFKSYFRKKSKTACIKEFDFSQRYQKNTLKKSKQKRASGKFRGKKFVDATREGYLDACIPYMLPNYKQTKKASKPVTLASVLRRSKSRDKKCERLSRAKCVRACRYASRESCTKYECSNRKKMTFNKICNDECRREYQDVRSSDSSDSSSDSAW